MHSQKYTQKKDEKNEIEYEEYSVTDEVLSYLKICECGRIFLNRHDVTYERAYMATTKDKYYTKMLETIIDYNDRNNAPLTNKNL